MTLWTIQTIDWYNDFLKKGTIYVSREHIDEYYDFCLFGYNWLRNKMDSSVGKRPFQNCYPIWAWYQYKNSEKKRPDLRAVGFLRKGTRGVRIEIKKKESEVLLSDFMLWQIPYFHHDFIGRNKNERKNFSNKLEKIGMATSHIGKLPKDLRKEMIKSWDRVLDLDFNDRYFTKARKNKRIQATFWSLSIDEVVKVDEFTAR